MLRSGTGELAGNLLYVAKTKYSEGIPVNLKMFCMDNACPPQPCFVRLQQATGNKAMTVLDFKHICRFKAHTLTYIPLGMRP